MPRSHESLKSFVKLYKRIDELEGEEAAERIMNIISQTLGGERLTIPDMTVIHSECRAVQIRRLYEECLTRSAIAERYGISISTVDRILKRPPLFGGKGEG